MVSLDDLIESIGSDPSEGRWYLDLHTEQLLLAPHSALNLIVTRNLTEQDLESAPEGVRVAHLVVHGPHGRFLELPGQLDVIEWTIMRKFATASQDARVSTQLLAAIGDVNAFNTFSQHVRRLRLSEDWEAFRQEQLRLIAIEWCEDHGLPIV